MIAVLAAAVMGTALIGAPARASEAPQAAGAPSPRQLALTRQYIDLMMTDQLEEAIRQMVSDQAGSDASTQNLPEEDRRFIVDLATDLTTDLIPQMVEEMVPVYARIFTEAELEALIAFYDTEIGRTIIEKTTIAMPEATRAAMTVMPQLLDKMAARICQHYGCEPGELEDLQRNMRGEIPVAPTRK